MRNQFKIIISLSLISVITFLGYNIWTKLNYKKEVAEGIRVIPKFSFRNIDGQVFTQKNVSKTGPKLFIYFNSECNYCQTEVKQIQENLHQLKDAQLIFVSFEDTKKIKAFATEYSLQNEQNIVFLKDKDFIFEDLFDAKTIPHMLLYSKDNHLIKKFKGLTKIEYVIMLLEQN
jgi:peroxiredoxin